MGTPYNSQLSAKRQRLVQALARYPHVVDNIDLNGISVRGATRTEGYRHRLKLPVQHTRQGVHIGLSERSGGATLHTPDCPVLAKGLRDALPPLLDWMRGKRGIHSLDLRVSSATGQLQAVFACRGGDLEGGPRGARALIRAVPKLASVAVSTADKARKRVMGSRPRVVAGTRRLDERIGDTALSLHAGAFFQVDPENALQLHEMVAEAVGGAQTVLDLYAGVGAYGRMLAPRVKRVVAVEEVPSAVAAAQAGAPRNLTVIQGRVEDVLDNRALSGQADAAVLNPARRGAVPSVLEAMAARVPRLVYVSCGPEALARDLDVLSFFGMRVRSVQALDLFPQTPEVEAVVLLERGPKKTAWPVPGGQATGPWGRRPSGAQGRPTELVVLVIGNTGDSGTLRGARFQRLGTVAGHSLLRVGLERSAAEAVLGELARMGHPVAGRHKPTDRFFAEKAGLLRPFVHVSAAGKARAPLHGDLVTALDQLGAPPWLRAKAGSGETVPTRRKGQRGGPGPSASSSRGRRPANRKRGPHKNGGAKRRPGGKKRRR